MLALTRKKGESLIIDGKIEVKILEVHGDKVRIGVNAPKEITVFREEVYNMIKESNQEATVANPETLKMLQAIMEGYQKEDK